MMELARRVSQFHVELVEAEGEVEDDPPLTGAAASTTTSAQPRKKKKPRLVGLALLVALWVLDSLNDTCLIHLLSLFPHKELLKTLTFVCKRWKKLIDGPELWKVMLLRPHHDGLHVKSMEKLLWMINHRWSDLRWLELPPELITPTVIQELAYRCPKLNFLTMDFSTAAQLHDFTDLQCFPSRLRSLTLCLSENIFLEGLLRKIYTYISSVEMLHVVGTYEKIEDEEEEVYETVAFVTDEHVESLSVTCAKLECLCVNYCNKVTAKGVQALITACKALTTLFLAHTSLGSSTLPVSDIAWESTKITELDISGTELKSEAIRSVLSRLSNLRWLKAGFLENFDDDALLGWMESGAAANLVYLDLDTCDSINEQAMGDFFLRHGPQLKACLLGGHHKLTENFWIRYITEVPNVETLVMGISEDCCAKVTTKITVDQFVDMISRYCRVLRRLELRWDDETLRFSDKSSKFIDLMRLRCQKLHSIVLADGKYYEIVRSNFERSGRTCVVRSTEMCHTNINEYLRHYYCLLFN